MSERTTLSPIDQANRLCHAGRPVLALDFDSDLVDELHAACARFDGKKLCVRPHLRSNRHHVGEADFVRTVIDPARHSFDLKEIPR